MFYDFSFTITAGKTQAEPEVQELPLTYGVVHLVTLKWWPGPHGLAHMIIRRFEHQVLPTNLEGSFHYDNYTHIMTDRIEIFGAPFTLKLEGWAPDCTYDHEVIIGIGILPPEAFPEYAKPDSRLAKLMRTFGIK